MIAPGMEELRTVTETHRTDRQQLILNGRMQTGFTERKCPQVRQVSPHIVDVGT